MKGGESVSAYTILNSSEIIEGLTPIEAYNIASTSNGYTSWNTGYGVYRWSVAVNSASVYLIKINNSLAVQFDSVFSQQIYKLAYYLIASNSPFMRYCPLWRNVYETLSSYSNGEIKTIFDNDYYASSTYVAGNGDDFFIENTGKFTEIDSEVNTMTELTDLFSNLGIRPVTAISYPITYHYTNSIVNGPSEAAVGDTVIVSVVSDVGYDITDASSQILVTNNDVAVPYTWDATNQRITFTMPDPT